MPIGCPQLHPPVFALLLSDMQLLAVGSAPGVRGQSKKNIAYTFMAFNLLYDLPPELQALVLVQMLESYKTRQLHCIDHLPFYDWYGSKTPDLRCILNTPTRMKTEEIKSAYGYPDYGSKLVPGMNVWRWLISL
jgi:hypothetical protein